MSRALAVLTWPAPLLSPLTLVDLASHPTIYPRLAPPAMALFESLHPRVKPWPPLSPACRADIFPSLAEATADRAAAAPLRLPGGAAVAPLATFSAALAPTWSNVLGNMHGGAACILGEQAAAASHARVHGTAAAPPARMMHVQLLSALVCDGRPAILEAVTSRERTSATATTPAGPAVEDASSVSTLRHARDAGRAAECAVWWT